MTTGARRALSVGSRALWGLFGLALATRLAVVAWAAGRVPPTADGAYFHVLASRLAAGLGYTWAWPDGVVTPAAHYPVGYPALVALGYAVFGARPVVGLLVNAVFAALAAPAVHALVRPAAGERRAFWAGVVVALHPALVPYVAAFMTESVGVGLVVVAAALAARARERADARASARADVPEGGARAELRAVATEVLPLGVALGLAVLVRPQALLLAPAFGALAVGGVRGRARVVRALAVTLVALAVCAPWTARNCVEMKQCALVSVNGGWNFLIGAQTPTGSYVPLETPEACLTVWDEAAKDACFAREGRAVVAADPWAFVEKVPAKLAATFDYFGAAPWYLHAANPAAFPARAKLALAAAETLAARVALLAALLAAGYLPGGGERGRKITAYALAAVALSEHAWPAYLGLAALLALRRGALREPPLALLVASVTALTALTHAVFFGGGRYGLVVVPFVVAAAALVPARARLAPAAPPPRDGSGLPGAPAGAIRADAGAVQTVAGLVSRREESPSSEGHDAG